MSAAVEALGWVLILGGAAFSVIGGIGLLRLPDVYARIHAAGLTDTLGAGLVLGALMLEGGLSLVTVKLMMILGFWLVTSPTATHALAHAAMTSGLPPWATSPGDAAGTTENQPSNR